MNIASIRERKGSGQKITMLTCYDYSFAKILDRVGIDMLLVGDSLGMVLLGYDSTVPVTLEDIIHHAKAVRRGTKDALVVGDMPFMTYQVSPQEAIRNAGRLMKEGGCDAVKLEGGTNAFNTISSLVRAGVPVVGHIGLTPQTASSLGGYKVQGRDLDSANKIVEDAMAVEEAGAFALVLECIPAPLASFITDHISIPTIGIGAGPGCDGQVLVTHDLLGMFEGFTPSFVKRYANLLPLIKDALRAFIDEVRDGTFPDKGHSFHLDEEIVKNLKWGK